MSRPLTLLAVLVGATFVTVGTQTLSATATATIAGNPQAFGSAIVVVHDPVPAEPTGRPRPNAMRRVRPPRASPGAPLRGPQL